MNRTSKLIRAGAVSLALSTGTLLALPTMSYAANSFGATGSTASPAESAFCSELPAKASAASAKLATLKTNLTTAQSKRTAILQANWSKWDAQLTALRAQWNQNRQTQYALLNTKATTAAEKTAVTTYQSTLTAAITSR